MSAVALKKERECSGEPTRPSTGILFLLQNMLKTVAGTVTATAAVRARARGVDGIGNDMEWGVLVVSLRDRAGDVFVAVEQPHSHVRPSWTVTRSGQSYIIYHIYSYTPAAPVSNPQLHVVEF